MTIAWGIAVCIAGLIGVVATLLGFSGVWLLILVALVAEWATPDQMFSLWTIGWAVALGALGELIEFIAGSIGATKAGGTKRAAAGAMVGGLAGAILGTPVFPIIGTILGAAIGAGVGAAVMDRTKSERTWREVYAVGQGAAVGRLIATIVKTALALAAAVLLGVAAFA